MTTTQEPADTGPLPTPLSRLKCMSLRAKFVVFFSLILILTCSTLSWYFIETRRAMVTENLKQLGTILITSVVNNRQFRYGALVIEDRATLQEFTDSLMAVEEVAYVVIRGADRMILAQHNKLDHEASGSPTSSQARRYYPQEETALRLYHIPQTPLTKPQMTLLVLSNDQILVPHSSPNERFWSLSPLTEHFYDFAIPVPRGPTTARSFSPFPLELDDSPLPTGPPEYTGIQGVVQIGISDALAMQELMRVIRHVFMLTALVIGAGILGTHLLTMRVTTPIRNLAAVARRLAEGDIPPPLTPATYDEVGRLTDMFNRMTRSLHERNLAINANLDVIKRQISQLSAVHQTSAVITSTLDLNQLLDTVLQLLITNLGFSRMLLMLRRDDREAAYVAQVAGVSEDISNTARRLEIPIQDVDTLIAELLIRAKPILADNIDAVAHRMHPTILALARQVGITSFVAVPLQSHNRTLGFLAGDRDTFPCTGEDLSILVTIAGHVAAAIDNARAYAHLTELTQHLEQRIQERTRELSVANERLQDHDRRRSMFISVASHELRTPMTAIRSFTDNMRDGVTGPLTERQSTYLSRIGHNLDRLTRIINQLLDWSRLDLSKEVLRLEPLCIQQMTILVVESLQPVAAQKQIAIDVDCTERTPPIHGDRDKVEQILWNLVGNAVKFTSPQGRVTVEFTTTPDRFVQTTVKDTGCGIQPADLPKIFNEFSKVPSAMPTSQGAQLGLCITKTLVMMHKGNIWVESAPGAGTRFFFTLPIAETQPDPQRSSTEHSSANIER